MSFTVGMQHARQWADFQKLPVHSKALYYPLYLVPLQLCMHTVHCCAKKVPIYMRVTGAVVVPNNKCEAPYGQQVTMATAMIIIGRISCKRNYIGMLRTGPTQLTGKRAQITCGADAVSSDNRPRAKSR